MKKMKQNFRLILLAIATLLFCSCGTQTLTIKAIYKYQNTKKDSVVYDSIRYTYIQTAESDVEYCDIEKTSKIKEIGYSEKFENHNSPVVLVLLEDGHVSKFPMSCMNGFDANFAIGKNMTYYEKGFKHVEKPIYIKYIEKRVNEKYKLVEIDTLTDIHSIFYIVEQRINNSSKTINNEFFVTDSLNHNRRIFETKRISTKDTLNIYLDVWFLKHDTLILNSINTIKIQIIDSVLLDDTKSYTDVKLFNKKTITKNGQIKYMLKLAKQIYSTIYTYWVYTDKQTYDELHYYWYDDISYKWHGNSYIKTKYVDHFYATEKLNINIDKHIIQDLF